MAMLPKLKLKALVSFPSNVYGGTGIEVNKANGNFTVDLDYSEFAFLGSLPPNSNVLVWDPITDVYTLVPPSATGGISDAPSDSLTYGRRNGVWVDAWASPALSGNPTAPTPSPGDNDTSVATTAFVGTAIAAIPAGTPPPAPATAPPLANGVAAVGVSLKYAREDHVHPAGAAGSGDVVGPASSVADSIAVFNGTTGKIIKDGGALISGLQPANQAVRYDTAQGLTANQQAQARENIAIASVMRSYLAGLTLSTAGSSATFGIAAGVAANSTNTVMMSLASAYTKTTAAWAVGSGNGALDTGAIAAAAWYHVFLIRRPDTGVVDVLVSLSATAPTLPASYTQFRRIGSMLTAASQWVRFSQNGDEFLLYTTIVSASGVAGSTTAVLVSISVPTAVSVTAVFNVGIATGASNDTRAYFSSPDTSDEAPSLNMNVGISFSSSYQTWSQLKIRAVNQQIRYRMSNAGVTMYLSTAGWIDRRGKDA